MKADEFRNYSRKIFLFRVIDFLSFKRLIYITLSLVSIGGLVGLIDKSWLALASLVPQIMVWGLIAAFLALQWSRKELATTLDEIQPAFVDPKSFDEKIKNILDKYPNNLISVFPGILASLILIYLIPKDVSLLTKIYLYTLSMIDGITVSYGAIGFFWTCSLIGGIRSEPIMIFCGYKMRSLSAYICALGLIGIVPIMFMVFIQTLYPENVLLLLIIIGGSCALVLGFLFGEISVWRMISKARTMAINKIAEKENMFWKELEELKPRTENGNTDQKYKDILDQLNNLEKLRFSIQSHRIHIIPWDIFCIRILFPILIGVTVLICQLQMIVKNPN